MQQRLLGKGAQACDMRASTTMMLLWLQQGGECVRTES